MSASTPDSTAAGAPGSVVCLNHPDRPAVCACSLCAEPFCAACVTDPGPGAACVRCRPPEIVATAAPSYPATDGIFTSLEAAEAPRLARQALTFGIVSFFCFGFVLGPVAIVKGLRARRLLLRDGLPLRGRGMATAAVVLGSITSALNALAILNVFIGAMIGK